MDQMPRGIRAALDMGASASKWQNAIVGSHMTGILEAAEFGNRTAKMFDNLGIRRLDSMGIRALDLGLAGTMAAGHTKWLDEYFGDTMRPLLSTIAAANSAMLATTDATRMYSRLIPSQSVLSTLVTVAPIVEAFLESVDAPASQEGEVADPRDVPVLPAHIVAYAVGVYVSLMIFGLYLAEANRLGVSITDANRVELLLNIVGMLGLGCASAKATQRLSPSDNNE